nr:hypothetical protein [Arthrobacter glacialis]
MYDKNPIENWVSGRMTLIGEAAHPMLQHLAQGACQALENAAVLLEVTQATICTDEGIDSSAREDAFNAFNAFNDFNDFNEARAGRTARVWGEPWYVSGLA